MSTHSQSSDDQLQVSVPYALTPPPQVALDNDGAEVDSQYVALEELSAVPAIIFEDLIGYVFIFSSGSTVVADQRISPNPF